MTEPTLEQLDNERKQGFRPSVTACFLNADKILFLFKKEYKIWALPQGGINNGETAHQALDRIMPIEVGEEFFEKCDKDYILVHYAKTEFAQERQGMKELKTDTGENIFMKGKSYYFYAIAAFDSKLDVGKSDYDECFWLDYKAAKYLAGKIYIPDKAKMANDVVELLKEQNLLK